MGTIVKHDADDITRQIVQRFIDIAHSDIMDVVELCTEKATLMYKGSPIKSLSAAGRQKEITLMEQYLKLREGCSWNNVKEIIISEDGRVKKVAMDEKAKFYALNFLYEHIELVNRALMFNECLDNMDVSELPEEIDFKQCREIIYEQLAA